ncbi:hypothetical protein Tco_1238074 [Tanacetum coccineum]
MTRRLKLSFVEASYVSTPVSNKPIFLAVDFLYLQRFRGISHLWYAMPVNLRGDVTTSSVILRSGTDNQEKDEKQSQNDKTGLGMEETAKDKAKSKPESQSSQKVNRKVNGSKSKST